MGAQHRIHRLEHVAHPRLADRALDHHNQFRLVGRCPHQTPAAILDRDAHAVDGDEIADLLPRDLLALFLQRLEVCFTTASTTPYLVSSAQCGDIVGDDQVFFKSAIDLPGARSSISQIAIAEIRPSS